MKRALVVAVLALVTAAGMAFLVGRAGDQREAGPSCDPRPIPSSGVIEGRFEVDLRVDGPLGGGSKVSLERALESARFDFPILPTNCVTGPLSSIWRGNGKFAYVWDTLLTAYVENAGDRAPELAATWERIAQERDLYRLVTLRGGMGIASTGGTRRGDPSATLTFIDDEALVQLIGRTHTLPELLRIAEQITYETS